MLKHFNGCLVHINPDRAFLPPTYLTRSQIQNVPLTCHLSTAWCLSASGDLGAVRYHRDSLTQTSTRHLISPPPIAHLSGGWSHMETNRELYCWRRKLMVYIPISSDLKSPKSIVSSQPSPSAASLSKEKWPEMFVRIGCVAQNLTVGSLHLSQ